MTRPTISIKDFGLSTALFISTFLLFSTVRQFDFLNWDDLTFIARNDHVVGGLTWESVKWFFTNSYSANWAPLSWISHMLDTQLYGLKPAGHHLTNVFFHAANSALLFLVMRAFTGKIWRSAFVAALFAFHPVHVESVAWIAERRDVLSGFFFMLTLLAYAAYAKSIQYTVSSVQSSKKTTATRSALSAPRSTLLYALTLALFACGLMSKPMLVTVPCVLLLLDFWPLKRTGGLANIEDPASTNQDPKSEIHISKSKIKNRKSKIWFEKLPFFALAIASSIITFISQKHGGAVASLETVSFSSRFENAAVAYLQYLLKFFYPTNLSPFYPHPDHWEMWRVATAVIVLVVVTVLAWKTRVSAPYVLVGWLWFLGMLVPVIGIVQVGSQAFADRYTYLPLIGIMIAVTWLVSDLALGFVQFRAFRGKKIGSLPLACVSVVLLTLLSWRTAAQLPYWRDTETLFRRALQISPQSVQALYGLGTSLIDAGRVDEGLPFLKEAIRLQPRYPQALGAMGNLLDGQGKYAEAIDFYEAGAKADPNEAGILNNLAWLRAACADPKFRDGAEAVRLATRACELTSDSKPIFIGTLAAAQAEAGDFSSAINTAERAAELATKLRLADTAAKNRELIELYKQGKAAHGGPPGNPTKK